MSQFQITDLMLEEAVEHFADALISSLPAPSECDHTFSPEFEAKMDKLLKKAKKQRKPLRFVQRAAVIFLTIMISAATWLAVDNEARASFVRWTRELCGNTFLYRYFGQIPDQTIPDYHISSLPDGCNITSYSDSQDTQIAVFTTTEGDRFLFAYYYIYDGRLTAITTVGDDTINQEPVLINGIEGTFYDLADEKYADSLFWIDDATGIAFELQSFCSKDVMLNMAESVEPGQMNVGFPEYSLSWIPEGYGMTGYEVKAQNNSIRYSNGKQSIDFELFHTAETDILAAFDIESIETTSVKINGKDAIFFPENGENRLLWLDPEAGTAFSLTAVENMDTMLEMAERVHPNH